MVGRSTWSVDDAVGSCLWKLCVPTAGIGRVECDTGWYRIVNWHRLTRQLLTDKHVLVHSMRESLADLCSARCIAEVELAAPEVVRHVEFELVVSSVRYWIGNLEVR